MEIPESREWESCQGIYKMLGEMSGNGSCERK